MISPKPYIERLTSDERIRSQMTDEQFRPLINSACDFLIALSQVATHEEQLQTACEGLLETMREANQNIEDAK